VNPGCPKVALADVAELNPRLGETLGADETVSFVPMSAVSAETADITNEETRSYSDVAKGYTPFISGDVLLAKITPCFENGKIAQARLSHRAGFGSTEFHVVRPRSGKLDGRYVLHFLRQKRVLRAGERRMTGSAGQRRVPEHFLSQLEIPLPPLAEQQRIAEVLDRAEALRAKRRAALAQLDSLTQSLFLDLFGDPVTNSKGWEFRRIGEELTLQGGYAFKSSDYTTVGVRLVKISNVHKNNLEWSDTDHLPTRHLQEFSDFSLCPGDVVLALTRPIIKSLNSVKIAVVQPSDVPCLLNQRVGRFRFRSNSRLSPAYLLEYCRTKTFFNAVQRFCSESLQPNMSTRQVEDVNITVPPIELQREFARRVLAVETLKTTQRASLAELNALFATLQHRAFRGEL